MLPTNETATVNIMLARLINRRKNVIVLMKFIQTSIFEIFNNEKTIFLDILHQKGAFLLFAAVLMLLFYSISAR